MTDLTTLTNVEAWLGLPPGNADEALLQRLVTSASGFVESWCGRQFAQAAYTETRHGTGGWRMPFANPPVTAVTGVTIDGQAVTGFSFTPTILALDDCRFTGKVVLSYVAGYATIPAELEQAVIELAAMAYREKDRTGLSSHNVAGETTAFIIKDMPPRVATVLTLYRKVVPL